MYQHVSKKNQQQRRLHTPHAAKTPRFARRAVQPMRPRHQTMSNHGLLRRLAAEGIQPKLKIGAPNDRYEQEADAVAKQENDTGLPDTLKIGIETLSGLSMDEVKVHYNSSKPAQLQALAYTQGQDIHVGPGQEKHLPHEGWHAVQQMQGRVKPTIRAKSVSLNDDVGLEREADVMGAKAMQKMHVSQNSSNAKVPDTYSSGFSGGDKYEQEADQVRRVQEPQGKQLMAHPLAHVMQNGGEEVVQRTPAAPVVLGVAEWIGVAALGFAVTNEPWRTSGDISWKLDEAEGVLLPGGRENVKEYQKENPDLTIKRKELEVSFWRGTKGGKKLAGITFGLTFSTDGKGIGDISTRIMPGGTHEGGRWGAKCSVDLMPESFVSASGKVVIRVTLTNSWAYTIPWPNKTFSGVDSTIWQLEGDGTFKVWRDDDWMWIEHRLT